ncbi:MAG: HlyD family efflux transporter periplasmic adaptor subunit [Firmicutes bacterium]|nr:HlyD family efflux transporter periplasmic adaptor subunit [Bacillota bacterium]
MKKRLFLVIAVLTMIIVAAGCHLLPTEKEPESNPVPTPVTDAGVIAEANLVPAKYSALRFALPGKVAEITVTEGDYVEEGQVLARLGNVESLEAQLLAADLAVVEAEQRLKEVKRYYADTDPIALAESALDVAESQQLAAQKALDDAKIAGLEPLEAQLLAADMAVMEAEQTLNELEEHNADQDALDLAEAALDTAEGQQRAAQRALDDASTATYEPLEAQLSAADLAVMDADQKLRALERKRREQDDVKLAQVAYDLAKGQQRAARKALEEDVKLTAPFAGKVISIELEEGVYTSPAEVALVLADNSTWYLETFDLDENEVVRISEGDRVEILFDALPGQSFTGEVESISEYFLERFGNVTYVVKISLAEKDERLRWGMTAEVSFPE